MLNDYYFSKSASSPTRRTWPQSETPSTTRRSSVSNRMGIIPKFQLGQTMARTALCRHCGICIVFQNSLNNISLYWLTWWRAGGRVLSRPGLCRVNKGEGGRGKHNPHILRLMIKEIDPNYISVIYLQRFIGHENRK